MDPPVVAAAFELPTVRKTRKSRKEPKNNTFEVSAKAFATLQGQQQARLSIVEDKKRELQEQQAMVDKKALSHSKSVVSERWKTTSRTMNKTVQKLFETFPPSVYFCKQSDQESASKKHRTMLVHKFAGNELNGSIDFTRVQVARMEFLSKAGTLVFYCQMFIGIELDVRLTDLEFPMNEEFYTNAFPKSVSSAVGGQTHFKLCQKDEFRVLQRLELVPSNCRMTVCYFRHNEMAQPDEAAQYKIFDRLDDVTAFLEESGIASEDWKSLSSQEKNYAVSAIYSRVRFQTLATLEYLHGLYTNGLTDPYVCEIPEEAWSFPVFEKPVAPTLTPAQPVPTTLQEPTN